MNRFIGCLKLIKHNINPFGKFQQLDTLDDKELQEIIKEFSGTYISLYCDNILYKRNLNRVE